MSSFILGVVKSDAFQMKRAEATPTTRSATVETANDRARRRRECTSSPESTFPAARSSAAWARRWRCRSSTRWCRPGAAPRGRRGRRQARGWSASRRCTALAGCNNWGASQAPVRARDDRPRLHARAGQPAQHARAVPRPHDDRQQHRRAQRRGVRAAGDRRRSLPLERGVPHAVASEADAGLRPLRRHVARSALRASASGQDTPMPSMQFCIENLDQAGGCTYNYSCAYTDTISWASPNEPLPMIRDPRVAFDMLFGVGQHAGRARRAPRDAQQHPRLDRRRGRARPPRSSAPAIAQRLDQLPRQRARDRAPHPGGRGAQPQRRGARAARRAGRRARFVRRAHEADVRPPGAGAADRHDAHHLVQDRPRRAEPRLPGERIEPAVPPGLAPRQPRGADHGVQQDLQVPRRPARRTSSTS